MPFGISAEGGNVHVTLFDDTVSPLEEFGTLNITIVLGDITLVLGAISDMPILKLGHGTSAVPVDMDFQTVDACDASPYRHMRTFVWSPSSLETPMESAVHSCPKQFFPVAASGSHGAPKAVGGATMIDRQSIEAVR